MSEETKITPEMIAEYQRQQVAQEQAAMQQCISDLAALAAERGFVIMAMPKLSNGRIEADWGIGRKQ